MGVKAKRYLTTNMGAGERDRDNIVTILINRKAKYLDKSKRKPDLKGVKNITMGKQ